MPNFQSNKSLFKCRGNFLPRPHIQFALHKLAGQLFGQLFGQLAKQLSDQIVEQLPDQLPDQLPERALARACPRLSAWLHPQPIRLSI